MCHVTKKLVKNLTKQFEYGLDNISKILYLIYEIIAFRKAYSSIVTINQIIFINFHDKAYIGMKTVTYDVIQKG